MDRDVYYLRNSPIRIQEYADEIGIDKTAFKYWDYNGFDRSGGYVTYIEPTRKDWIEYFKESKDVILGFLIADAITVLLMYMLSSFYVAGRKLEEITSVWTWVCDILIILALTFGLYFTLEEKRIKTTCTPRARHIAIQLELQKHRMIHEYDMDHPPPWEHLCLLIQTSDHISHPSMRRREYFDLSDFAGIRDCLSRHNAPMRVRATKSYYKE